jgi:hypothetical protein
MDRESSRSREGIFLILVCEWVARPFILKIHAVASGIALALEFSVERGTPNLRLETEQKTDQSEGG